DLAVAHPGLVPQLLFDVVPDGGACARQAARRARLALVHDATGLRECELLHVVAAEPQAVTGRECRDGSSERLTDQRDVSRSMRVRRLAARGCLFVRQARSPALDTHAIDVPLHEYRAQPRRQAAAPLVVPKERLPLSGRGLDAVQLCVQRIRSLTRALRTVQR